MYIAIEGSIASGKSTTARSISEELGLALVHEQTHRHPFIEEFYADPKAFAFETELSFALLHYHQLHQLRDADIAADFSPGKDLIFARMNLIGDELAMFTHLHDMLTERVPEPDIVVFLDLPVEECRRRCIARGRPFEAGIKPEYLTSLRDYYLRYLPSLGKLVERLEVSPGQNQRQVAKATLDVIHRLSGPGS